MIDSGIIVIDKPAGLTSAQVVSRVKKITGASKVGHTGTLDPFATGLMICGINSGTRISRFFLGGDKSYEAELHLGIETDTLDCTGSAVNQCDSDFFTKHPNRFTPEAIHNCLQGFLGPQQQLPPVYSALKHKGVPLYKLARQGKPVQKPPRLITIHDISLIELKLPVLKFHVSCSSGTYIRTLASDIGKVLECGGHLSGLRRTETCGFSLGNAATLDDLESSADIQGMMISMADALPGFQSHTADDTLEQKIKHGVTIVPADAVPAPCGDQSHIKIVNKKGRLISILEFDKKKGAYNYCCVFHN